jgi:hypothetical protein
VLPALVAVVLMLLLLVQGVTVRRIGASATPIWRSRSCCCRSPR